MINKIAIRTLACFLLLMLATGCEKVDQNIPRVGVVFYRSEDAFMSVLKNELTTKALGKLELFVNDSENSQDLQNDQIDAFISRSMDFLAINMVDLRASEELMRLAKRKDIPLIFFNREPESDLFDRYDNVYYVGTDSGEAGKLQGQMVADSWQNHPAWDKNGDGVLQYVLLMGEEGHMDTIERSRLLVQSLSDRGIASECLAKDFANWDNIEGKALMDQWLSTYGSDIEYVVSNNDAMAIGALASLQEQGYFSKDKFMPVVGVDGIPAFMLKVENGLAVGTVINDAEGQSAAIVDLCSRLWSYEKSREVNEFQEKESRIIRVPYILITKANVGEYIED